MKLPEAFLNRMKTLLGDEYQAFLRSYDETPVRGLRINPMKLSQEEFEASVPFPVRRIPWVRNGYFYPSDVRPSLHPFYQAGLYYLQEPSAMTPGDRLEIEAGERVLDLCAAPGGKATQLAAKLLSAGDGGLLVANEISNARAKALLRNLELFGARNFLVTNERPDRLSESFPLFFDKILIDAPCSGEGMFRRQPDVADAWSEEKVRKLAALQKQILEEGYRMLKVGGQLLYSTCTFSPSENEENIAWFLVQHPDITLIPIRPYDGFAEGRTDWVTADLSAERLETIRRCVRIWPHRMEGEGHFLALMKKEGAATANSWEMSESSGGSGKRPRDERKKLRKGKTKGGKQNGRQNGRQNGDPADFRAFLDAMRIHLPEGKIEIRGEHVYLQPDLPVSALHLKFLRCGVCLGELKKNRFEPSQPFALILSRETCGACMEFSPEDPDLAAFLAGGTIRFDEEDTEKRKAAGTLVPGWKLILAGGFPVGWGKYADGILKNKIPQSWRTEP
jgi:NOL1/NOP2/sun family putative RNA methylase